MEKFITETLREAGQVLLELFGKVDGRNFKADPTDTVTEADLRSQKIILDAIAKRFPDHTVIAEEESEHKQAGEYTWYVDPLDGTRNFATRVPLFAVQIALAHKGTLTHAGIYLPTTDEMCYAEKGKGSFLNGRRLQRSQKKEWPYSFGLGSQILKRHRQNEAISAIMDLSDNTAFMNGLGSLAVSAVYLADGRRDWLTLYGASPWDYAAPALVMQEAGCIVTNWQGNPWSVKDEGIIVSNPQLHPPLIEALRNTCQPTIEPTTKSSPLH